MKFQGLICRITITFFCLSLFISCVFSQNKISFGKVSMEELTMSRYENDSTAEAVIISDIGKFDGIKLNFNRHIRIKILKKSGTSWGNWIFNTPSKSDFDVLVFNLAGGQITQDKVSNSSIYREQVVENFQVYKVFIPNVKVGTVIDIKYEYVGLPFEWRFQEKIPIAYSELTLEPTPYVTYTKTSFGLDRIETVSPIKWRAVSMPAFRIEPFINYYGNYLTRFSIQLESITYRGVNYPFSTTWRQIIDNLLKHPLFGHALERGGFLNAPAEEIASQNLTTAKAIEAAYHYIRTNAKWNGTKSLYATDFIKKNFENHSCNSAEINLLLITLLNKIGIKAFPVVLSTRENGLLVEFSPTASKLNYVVAYVDYDNTRMLLDATSEFTTPGILPRYCLNGAGLVIKDDGEQWVDLLSKNRESKTEYVDINVVDKNQCKVTVLRDYNGYAYLDWIENLKKTNYDSAVLENQVKKEEPDIADIKYQVVSRNPSLLTSKEKITADVSSHLVDAGDELIMDPFIFFEYAENPFKSDLRKTPLDLYCPKDYRNTIVIKLPKGISARTLPPTTKLVTPDGGASFTFFSNSNQNKIELMMILKFNKYIFSEVEYLELRQFFSEIIKVINTPVTLSKT